MHLPGLVTFTGEAVPSTGARLAGYDTPVPVWSRSELLAGQAFAGPALVTETVATTWLPAGWRATVDAVGNLMLEPCRREFLQPTKNPAWPGFRCAVLM